MNRRKFLDLLRIGGTAAAVAPIAAKAVEAEKSAEAVFTVEPGEKYISQNGIYSFTSMSSPVVKWSKVHDPEKW